jgi:hypothetical protein
VRQAALGTGSARHSLDAGWAAWICSAKVAATRRNVWLSGADDDEAIAVLAPKCRSEPAEGAGSDRAVGVAGAGRAERHGHARGIEIGELGEGPLVELQQLRTLEGETRDR